jgi:threonine synthase
LTQYISTRGEAPALGFCDVMLAGLARDGGLYVPEVWPQLSAQTIAGFFGRPYWEVAVDVIRPFVANEISDADLGRMANEAYATFRHPAVVPLDQTGPNQFLLELFHGPTLAFKDVAMQLLSRLMDHVLAKREQRTTIVVATSGDTGGAAVDAFAGLDNVDLIVLFPHGRISDVQRRMMTTSGAGNVHALAVEGTFDDCQAIVKELFNDHAFRDAVALSGVNSIGRRPWGAGAQRRLHRADGQLRRHLRRLRGQAHGAADQVAAHCLQRQRHPAAHAEDRYL